MTVIALGIVALVAIALLGALVWVAVTFSRALQGTLDFADRVHGRDDQQLHSVLDRLMSRDLETFKIYDLLKGPEEHADVEYPEEAADRPWDVPAVVLPGRGLAGGDKIVEEEGEQ